MVGFGDDHNRVRKCQVKVKEAHRTVQTTGLVFYETIDDLAVAVRGYASIHRFLNYPPRHWHFPWVGQTGLVPKTVRIVVDVFKEQRNRLPGWNDPSLW